MMKLKLYVPKIFFDRTVELLNDKVANNANSEAYTVFSSVCIFGRAKPKVRKYPPTTAKPAQ